MSPVSRERAEGVVLQLLASVGVLASAIAWLPGCGFGPLDLLGMEAAVTEGLEGEPAPEDDRLEDKDPLYDPSRTVVERFGSCEVTLNKSAAVTKLDVVPLSGGQADLATRVFRGRTEAVQHLAGEPFADATLIPSMETVNGAMKPLNDGVYAAVEYGVEQGIEDGATVVYPSKRRFLHDLLAALVAMAGAAPAGRDALYEAAALDVGAGLLLAGEDPAMPADLLAGAAGLAAAFEEEPLFSRPIGFYAWDPVLGQVFLQDRFLQNTRVEYPDPLDPYSDAEVGKAAAMALAIQSDAGLMDRYEGYLALYPGLTNPFANHPVTSLLPYLAGEASLDEPALVRAAFLSDNPPPALPSECQPHFALFPSSASKETTYFESKFCGAGAPTGTDYMQEWISAITEGLVDLAPGLDSGWYDYQTWALETLLLPDRGIESENLLLTAAYKQKLLDTFRSIMTQNRETHLKQLEMGTSRKSAEPEEIDVSPLLPVEPFPTFYLRFARAYRFLGTYLDAVLGPAFLDGTGRMFEDGTRSGASLREDLRSAAVLLYGLHLVAAGAAGSPPELLPEEMAEYGLEPCREAALLWIASWDTDPDVLRDPRVIVPVQRDMDRRVAIYWAVLGVKAVRARAEFVEGREPEIVSSGHCTVRGFDPHDYWLLVEAFAQVELPLSTPPPTRDELRAVCDASDTVEEIVAALESP